MMGFLSRPFDVVSISFTLSPFGTRTAATKARLPAADYDIARSDDYYRRRQGSRLCLDRAWRSDFATLMLMKL